MTTDEALIKLLDESKRFLIALHRKGVKVPLEEYTAFKAAVQDASTCYHKPGSPMHGWRLQRRETGLLEAICEHGVGHPIPESAKFMATANKQDEWVWTMHGCDGCCSVHRL